MCIRLEDISKVVLLQYRSHVTEVNQSSLLIVGESTELRMQVDVHNKNEHFLQSALLGQRGVTYPPTSGVSYATACINLASGYKTIRN